MIGSAEDDAAGLAVDAVALRRWRRLDAGSMRRNSGTVASAITTARRTKNTSAKGAVLPSGMKVVKSAKYSTTTGFMYAGVGDLEGKSVGVELEGDEVGDVVGLEVGGEIDGDTVGSEVVGETVGETVGVAAVGDAQTLPLSLSPFLFILSLALYLYKHRNTSSRSSYLSFNLSFTLKNNLFSSLSFSPSFRFLSDLSSLLGKKQPRAKGGTFGTRQAPASPPSNQVRLDTGSHGVATRHVAAQPHRPGRPK